MIGNQEQSYKICLIGEGVIPRIEIISPRLKQHKIGTIVFPMTCLGSSTQRSIIFKNTSSPKSVVLINIVQQHYDKEPRYWLKVEKNCQHMARFNYGKTIIYNTVSKNLFSSNK